MCTTAYVVWPTTETSVSNLLCAKTRVSPLNRISTPRSEMQAAVMSVRLRSTIKNYVCMEFNTVYHIGDLEYTLAMLKKDSVALKEFMGNRVTECLEGSSEVKWYHTASHLNISDLGTRRLARVEDISRESPWTRGPDYLQLPKDEWLITRDINSQNLPKEELRTKRNIAAVTTSSPVIDIARLIRSYSFLIRTTAQVLKITRSHTFKIDNLSGDDINMAETYLIKREQDGEVKDKFEKGHLRSLRPCLDQDGVVVVGGRVPQRMGQTTLQILARSSTLAQMYAKKVHDEAHTRVSSTAAKIRNKFWVIGGRRVAAKIKHQCVECRKNDKELCDQQMAPLPTHRVTPARPFATTSLDLTRPYLVRYQVKKRSR